MQDRIGCDLQAVGVNQKGTGLGKMGEAGDEQRGGQLPGGRARRERGLRG